METKTYVTSKETFLKMKEDQKNVTIESRRAKKAFKLWRAKNPTMSTLDSTPEDAIYYKGPNPRYMNIVYGLVKGRTYQQIEQKVRQDNAISMWSVYKICDLYKLDHKKIESLIWPIV